MACVSTKQYLFSHNYNNTHCIADAHSLSPPRGYGFTFVRLSPVCQYVCF